MTQQMNEDVDEVPSTAWNKAEDYITIDRATRVVGEWSPAHEAEYTLYHLMDGPGEQDPLFALTETTREIDSETGETTEETEIIQHGELVVDAVYTFTDDDLRLVIDEVLENVLSFDRGTYQKAIEKWMESIVTTTIENQTNELTLVGDVVTVTRTDVDAQLDWFVKYYYDYDGQRGEDKKDRVKENMRKVLEAIGCLNEAGSEITYKAKISLGIPDNYGDEYRLDAVKHYQRGVFKNREALATVKALSDARPEMAQKRIAERIGTDPSTVSRQLSEIEEWVERAEWTAKNE